jgi:sec-independent protein translocase protein TatB
VFDLSMSKLLFLAIIALVVFGPHELPKIAQQAGRALRDLRRIAEGATADLREGLGPEFQDFELQDLSPRRFVQKHLLDDLTPGAQPADEDFGGTTTLTHETAPAGVRSTLLDGEDPPFDLDAT